VGSCYHGRARPRVEDGGDDLQIWRTAAKIFNKQSRQPTRGGSAAWELGEGLTAPHRKKRACYGMLHRVSEGSCEHGNEPSTFIKYWEFLDWLCDYQLHGERGL
jgi:hypothetical protein